jgi:hypothetical protein
LSVTKVTSFGSILAFAACADNVWLVYVPIVPVEAVLLFSGLRLRVLYVVVSFILTASDILSALVGLCDDC